MLKGKTIAVTRSAEDSGGFVELVNSQLGNVLSLPTIELVPKGSSIVKEFLNAISAQNPDFSAFMSSKAVKLLFETSKEQHMFDELRLSVSNTIVVAVGPKTKNALEEYGIRVQYMPKKYNSVGIGEVMTGLDPVGKKVIIPRSGASTPFLSDLLKKINLEVQEVYLYDIKSYSKQSQAWDSFADLLSKGDVDCIVFTSASSVRSFFEMLSKRTSSEELFYNLRMTKCVAIGPFTAEEMKKFNLEPIISEVHTIAGVFEKLKELYH